MPVYGLCRPLLRKRLYQSPWNGLQLLKGVLINLHIFPLNKILFALYVRHKAMSQEHSIFLYLLTGSAAYKMACVKSFLLG